jgi:hypothetical protein
MMRELKGGGSRIFVSLGQRRQELAGQRQKRGCDESASQLQSAAVKRLRQILGMIILVLWVPITTHCMLEAVPGLEFLKCAPSATDNCANDTCSQVESATYKVSNTHSDFERPALVLTCLLVAPPLEPDRLTPNLSANAPDIPRTWQFSHRAALPPRAPSRLS